MRFPRPYSYFILTSVFLLCQVAAAAEKDPKIVSAGPKKSYICTLGSVIWNQDIPCEQDTPVRDQMFKMYKASAPATGRESPLGLARPSKTNANLSQLVNFPEEYLRQTVQLENLWLYGNVFRNRSSSLPSDKSSVVVIQDKFSRKVPVALDNSIGLRFADKLQPDQVYPVEEVLISVQALGEGYLPYIKGLKFGSGKSRTVKVNFKQMPNPILGGQESDYNDRRQAVDAEQPYDYEYNPENALPPQEGMGVAQQAPNGPGAQALSPRLPLGEEVDSVESTKSGLEMRDENYDPNVFGQRHYKSSEE